MIKTMDNPKYQFSEYQYLIDRQFGATMRVHLDKNEKVDFIEDWEYKGKLSAALIGKTIPEVKKFFTTRFKGVYFGVMKNTFHKP